MTELEEGRGDRRGEDVGGVPPTPEWMETSLSPPGTLQKEFAVFLRAEITFVAGLKKKSFRAKKCCCSGVWRD